MKRLLAVAAVLSLAWAKVEVTSQPVFAVVTTSVPLITISTEFRISLIPNVVVIERIAQPSGVVVVYQSNRVADVYSYHHRDLTNRGWVRVKYQAKNGGYRAEYRRGRGKAKVDVWDKRGKVEVRVREN